MSQTITIAQPTSVGTTSVIVYNTSVKEQVKFERKHIPIPSSTRGGSQAETRTLDNQKVITGFLVKGHFEDEQRTQLNGALNSSDTTITVDSTTGFASSGLVKVGLELCYYSGTTATTFTGVTRGIEGTIAIAHADNTHVFIPAAQFRNQLYTIVDYGGAFRMTYRTNSDGTARVWSVFCDSCMVDDLATDDESERVLNIELALTVGRDLTAPAQSTGLITGRN